MGPDHSGHNMSHSGHDMSSHAGHDMSSHAGHDMASHAGHDMSHAEVSTFAPNGNCICSVHMLY